MAASIRKGEKATYERVANWISKDKYTDVPNLYGQLYPHKENIKDIGHWRVPGGVGEWIKYPFHEIQKQNFSKAAVGDVFEPLWSTHWFKLQFDVPSEWKGKEVRLRWDSSSEAMIYDEKGKPLQGFTSWSHGKRTDFIISRNYQPCASYTYYIEMACNHIFGGGSGVFGDIEPPDPKRTFTLCLAEIAVFSRQVYKLIMDLECLLSMSKSISEGNPRRYAALYKANHMVTLHIEGRDEQASLLADAFFEENNGSDTHTVGVMGNCHLDTAWLWPYSETIRKAARSFSSQLGLMRLYDDFIFVASQAQQFQWLKEYYPALFEEIKEMVVRKKFVPVGGVWVEMDGNMPSGESFVRQFLFGQRFFQSEFGLSCKEFWLPDTFGYSANIPQILKHMGIKRFLTQKLSWSFFNKFPHQTFYWEGIDGSTVLAHFPPGDDYTMQARAEDALFTVKNLRDKGRTRMSAMLYGFGDGGGGPNEDMLERTNRLKDVNGVPKMKHVSPDELFKSFEEDADKLMRWTGELYLELHNGTYTTQAEIKRLNRRCEMKLHDAELMLTVALQLKPQNAAQNIKNQAILNDAWKKVLLNQFHDVLPGSCIELVVQDAHKLYQEVLEAIKVVDEDTWKQLFGEKGQDTVLVNCLPWDRKEVIRVSSEVGSIFERQRGGVLSKATESHSTTIQYDAEGAWIAVEAASMGWTQPNELTTLSPVSLETMEQIYILRNSLIEAHIDVFGRVVSLRRVGNVKEVVLEGDACNQLLIYSDMPMYWDAWDLPDYHLESRKPVNYEAAFGMEKIKVEFEGPLACCLKWSVNVGQRSSLKQKIILRAESPYLEFHTEVDWHENRKVLKVEFPVDLLVREATYDIQFGHISRPTNTNTSWDWAKYEVCGHKWADVSENGFGLSVMNDSKYGWSAVGNRLTMSLLKAPKKPDEHADMHSHMFKYAMMPHEGDFRSAGTIQRSYEFNMDLKVGTTNLPMLKIPPNWFLVDIVNVVLETVKPAEDNAENGYILRLFESFGRTSIAKITVHLTLSTAWLCGGMEDKMEELVVDKSNNVFVLSLSFKPFQLISVLIETIN